MHNKKQTTYRIIGLFYICLCFSNIFSMNQGINTFKKELLEEILEELYEGPWQNIVNLMSVDPQPLAAVNRDGRTLIHRAVGENYQEMVQLLLEYTKININSQDARGNTALHIATLWGYDEIIDLLLNHPDIDVNVKDKNGFTPLQIAINNNQQTSQTLIKNFIENNKYKLKKSLHESQESQESQESNDKDWYLLNLEELKINDRLTITNEQLSIKDKEDKPTVISNDLNLSIIEDYFKNIKP